MEDFPGQDNQVSREQAGHLLLFDGYAGRPMEMMLRGMKRVGRRPKKKKTVARNWEG